jgi:acyl dehydratase
MKKKLMELTVAEQLPASDWIKIDQATIDLFAEATGDHQWIHVDAERCAKESAFKCTIAHGFLTVTLMPRAFYQMVSMDPKYPTMLNYGVEKIRFIEPVRVNDKVRFVCELANIEQKSTGRLFYFSTKAEIEGRTRPAMQGTFLMMLLGAA